VIVERSPQADEAPSLPAPTGEATDNEATTESGREINYQEPPMPKPYTCTGGPDKNFNDHTSNYGSGAEGPNLVAKLGATIPNDLARRIGDRIKGEGAITFNCSAS